MKALVGLVRELQVLTSCYIVQTPFPREVAKNTAKYRSFPPCRQKENAYLFSLLREGIPMVYHTVQLFKFSPWYGNSMEFWKSLNPCGCATSTSSDILIVAAVVPSLLWGR